MLRGKRQPVANLFFDLDGTLTDPREGITRCMQHALLAVGRAAPPASALLHLVGPPLHSSFASLLGTANEALIERAIAAYRERFEFIGIFENRVQPGIAEALRTLSTCGHRLEVVSAKPTAYTRRILTHFNIRAPFDGVYGPSLTDRSYNKAILIRRALRAVACAPGVAVMIGDRADDILGARQNGIRSIAVLWGFGSQAELEAAKPGKIARSVAGLVATLQRFA
jgi:phosphoglycolate phosphatase